MLDVVLLLIVVALTTVTVLYGAGCEVLLENDSTRDSSVDAAE